GRDGSKAVTVAVAANLPSTCTDSGTQVRPASCCPATTATGHQFLQGQMVYLTPGESNFPAGYKVITGIGSERPSLTFTYAEEGSNASSTAVENFQAVGRNIKIVDNTILDAGHTTNTSLASFINRAAVQLYHGPYLNGDIARNIISDSSTTSKPNGYFGLDF